MKNSHEVIRKGVQKILEEANIPLHQHLQIVRALEGRLKTYAEQIKRNEQLLRQHALDRQDWHAHASRLTSITHLKGEPGEPGKPGRHAKPPKVEEIVSEILPLIPAPSPGRPGKDAEFNPDELFKEFIKRIQKEKPIDISHIKNAQSFIFKGKRYKTEELMHGGGSSSATGTNVYNEVVAGSGTAWTLTHTPLSGTLRLYANGQRLIETVDYTLSGTNITTMESWTSGTVLADYAY